MKLADKSTNFLRLVFSKTSISKELVDIILSFLFVHIKTHQKEFIRSIQNSISRNTKNFITHGNYNNDYPIIFVEHIPLELWGFSTNYGTSPDFRCVNCEFCGKYINWGKTEIWTYADEEPSRRGEREDYERILIKSIFYEYQMYSSKRYFCYDVESPVSKRLFCICGTEDDIN